MDTCNMNKTINIILNKVTVNGSLWIECNEKLFFGPGLVELLEWINDTGSISEAAKQMNMFYKKAWKLIYSLNERATCRVVIMQSGGENGGGSFITDEAIQLIKYRRSMLGRFKKFLENETKILNKGGEISAGVIIILSVSLCI